MMLTNTENTIDFVTSPMMREQELKIKKCSSRYVSGREGHECRELIAKKPLNLSLSNKFPIRRQASHNSELAQSVRSSTSFTFFRYAAEYAPSMAR